MSTDMESGFRDSYKIDDKCDRFSYEDILCGDSYLARIYGSNTRSRSNIGYHSRDCLSSSRYDSSSSSSSSSSSDSHGFSSSNSDSWSSDSSNSNNSSYDSFGDKTPLNVTVKGILARYQSLEDHLRREPFFVGFRLPGFCLECQLLDR